MTRYAILLAVLFAVLGLLACPTPRGGGGGGGDDDDNGDDDDASDDDDGSDDDDASEVEPGLFTYSLNSGYGDSFYQATILLPLESGFDCSDVDEYGSMEDSDQNFIVSYLLLGGEQSWEGPFESYESGCDMYDYADARCFGLYGMINGNEEYGDNDDSFRIDDYSSSSVEGRLVLSDVTYDFDIINCGEYSYDGYREEGAGAARASGPRLRTGPVAAPRPEPPQKVGPWKLRFR